MESEKQCLQVAVVGSGTMGTALAHTIATTGHACTLLTSDPIVVDTVNLSHCHPLFFSGLKIHANVKASTVFEAYISNADLIVMAVPSYEMRNTARQIAHLIQSNLSILSVTKGFEPVTHKLMSEVLREEFHASHIGTLSGPNITLDLIKNLPTVLIVASTSPQLRDHGRRAFSSVTVKIVTPEDIRSYEYASALKNIVALEVGVVTGLGLGDNFRALVLAAGMAEISQLMMKMGLNGEIIYGLAGLSDIFLTCSSHFAQNYAIGVQLGKGALLPDLQSTLKAKGETAEGLESVKAGLILAQQYGYQAPLLEITYAFMYQNNKGEISKDNFLSAAFKRYASVDPN